MNKDERKEYSKKYYLKHKEKLLEKQNEYYSKHKKEYNEYYLKNKAKIIEYQNSYQKEYDKTKMARANSLLSAYKHADKKNNRGECTLTAKWIVEKIFASSCVHCGETDWHKLGCNRLDNSKPHTPDNVEPCCYPCNIKELNKQLLRNNNGRFVSLQ